MRTTIESSKRSQKHDDSEQNLTEKTSKDEIVKGETHPQSVPHGEQTNKA